MTRLNTKLDKLGGLVECFAQFKLYIPGVGMCRPRYIWDNDELNCETIVGCLSIMSGKTILSLSRIETMWYDKGEITKILTIPILHSGDNRDVSELKVPEFLLPAKAISCIFKKVKR